MPPKRKSSVATSGPNTLEPDASLPPFSGPLRGALPQTLMFPKRLKSNEHVPDNDIMAPNNASGIIKSKTMSAVPPEPSVQSTENFLNVNSHSSNASNGSSSTNIQTSIDKSASITPSTTPTKTSNWKKLKGKAKQVAQQPSSPPTLQQQQQPQQQQQQQQQQSPQQQQQHQSGSAGGAAFQQRIVDVGSKLLALSALGDAGGDYKLGGERLRLTTEVIPSVSLPTTVYLDNPLQTSITFGRGTDANIKLDSIRRPYYISRKHATIRRDPNFKYTLIDEDSKTGCFVNDIKVKKHILNFGDVIRFGGPECNFGDIRVQPDSEFIYTFEKVKKSAALTQEEDDDPVGNRLDRIRQLRERVTTVFELGIICLLLPLSYLNPTVKEWTNPLFAYAGIEPPPFYVVVMVLVAIIFILVASFRR